jgi:hypothetical protein
MNTSLLCLALGGSQGKNAEKIQKEHICVDANL